MLFEALICVCLVCGAAYAAPSPPTWPSAYEVEYTISLPYVSSVQPTGLKYPVHIWWDQKAAMMRLSFYDGLDDVYITPDATYNLYPRITKRTCLVIGTDVGPTTGATGQDLGEEGLPPPLPDISTWQYAGTAQLPGKLPSHMWQMAVRSFEKVATYTFHTAQRDGRPLHLDMLGVNLLTGSHFDQYVVDFISFQPLISTRPFKPPMDMCKDTKDSLKQVGRMTTDQAMSLLPGVLVPSKRSNGSAGDIGAALHGQYTQEVAGGGTVSGPADPTSQTLAANLRYIQLWTGEDRAQLQQQLAAGRAQLGTGPGDSGAAAAVRGSVAPEDLFTLDVNKFVSWSDERWQATMMGRIPQQNGKTSKVSASRRGRGSALLGTFKRRLSDADLPASVDWRGTGADGPVKDQASCGSCWAFATAGAMTGSWFVATNESLSLSEQQLVDCSWDYQCPDSFCGGCWGGNPEGALQYVYDHGGITLEASYAYKGQNGVCRENQTAKSAAFKGFLSVPEKDEGALMEAVATYGPVAISFDAVHPTFKYYSEGVYYREDCGQDADHLNHAVTLVGYGTTPGGTDYWLLRNSWSQFWGEGGYFKMARKGNDCGVTVDGVIAVVDEDAAERARKRHDKKGKRTTLHAAEY